MHRSFLAGLLLVVLVPVASTVLAETTLIHTGALIDGRSDEVRSELSVIVVDGRIESIQDGYIEAGDADRLLDLKAHTLMPGFMDMHTHLTGEMGPKAYEEGFRMNPSDIALRSTVFAMRTLSAGFTTVRDLGDRERVSIALRDAIDRGWVQGPRVFTAGKAIGTTGGHADPTSGLNRVLMGDPGANEGVVNGAEAARQAVRQRYKDGSDLIKITATGGVLSTARNGQNPQFMDDELEAIIQTANDYGFHVAAHAHGAEGMKRAIRAGVHSIEHGTFMDDEAIQLFKQHGTWYIPTVLAGNYVAEKAEIDGFFPDVVRPKAREVGPQIGDTFARAYAAGVKIAFGTDCGVSPHGSNAGEFALMVAGGMPPMEAIRAATLRGAELLGIEERLGTVEAGKIADLVAVEGDPLQDISRLENMAFVMKEGAIIVAPQR
jgi:imidazolonepropionase-like amidohydrolase